jgi:hypothetical protein
VEMYLHSPTTPSWRGAQLGGAQCSNLICFRDRTSARCVLSMAAKLELYVMTMEWSQDNRNGTSK